MQHLILVVLTVWMWTTPDGVTHYTDTPERVPQKYWEQSEAITVGAWRDYPKLSIVETRPEDVDPTINLKPVWILGVPKE